MKIEVRNRCSDFNSYRAARVKSLFNAQNGCNFSLDAELPIESADWQLGLIVGPSGSGKTSLGRKVFADDRIYDMNAGWPSDGPIIDAIAPHGDFNAVTVDGGPIAAQDWCFIRPEDDARSLWSRELAPMGLRLRQRKSDRPKPARCNISRQCALGNNAALEERPLGP